LAGAHEVVEQTSSVDWCLSDGEKGIREISKMGNLLGEKSEGDIAVSS